jgi:exosortase/archaeosortase family protein
MSKKRKRDSQRRWARRLSRDKRKQAKPSYIARLRPKVQGVVAYLKRNWAVVKTCLLFGAFMLVFLMVYSKLLTGRAPMDDFRRFTAHATIIVLNFFGGHVKVAGTLVYSNDFSFDIIEACTGIIPIMIYVAAVLAYPSNVRPKAPGIFRNLIFLRPLGALLGAAITFLTDWRKLSGIVLGILGIYAVNIFRMVTLFLIGTYSRSFFDIAHYLIWQALMILVAIALWLLWTSRLAHAASK